MYLRVQVESERERALVAGRRGSVGGRVGVYLDVSRLLVLAVVVDTGAYACGSLATSGLPIGAGRWPRPGMWHGPGPASWNLVLIIHEALVRRVDATHMLSRHLRLADRASGPKDRFESSNILGLPVSGLQATPQSS